MFAAQPVVGRRSQEPSDNQSKSGQSICYRTGHFYLLLTLRTDFAQVPIAETRPRVWAHKPQFAQAVTFIGIEPVNWRIPAPRAAVIAQVATVKNREESAVGAQQAAIMDRSGQ